MWKNDKMNGFGKLDLSNDDYYKGEFLDSEFHGKGKYISIKESSATNKYAFLVSVFIGEFKNGKKNGFGTIVYDKQNMEISGIWEKDRIKIF
jgi:hypothetical protein